MHLVGYFYETYHDAQSPEHKALLMFVQVGSSMEQDVSRAGNGFSASEKIPRILWNPKAPYSVHTNPPLDRLSYESVPRHSILLLQYPFL